MCNWSQHFQIFRTKIKSSKYSINWNLFILWTWILSNIWLGWNVASTCGGLQLCRWCFPPQKTLCRPILSLVFACLTQKDGGHFASIFEPLYLNENVCIAIRFFHWKLFRAVQSSITKMSEAIWRQYVPLGNGLNCAYHVIKYAALNLHRWCLGTDKQFHPTHYWACDYLSMLGLKLSHVSKMGYR